MVSSVLLAEESLGAPAQPVLSKGRYYGGSGVLEIRGRGKRVMGAVLWVVGRMCLWGVCW